MATTKSPVLSPVPHTKGVVDLTFLDIKEEADVEAALPDKLPPLSITMAGFERTMIEGSEVSVMYSVSSFSLCVVHVKIVMTID